METTNHTLNDPFLHSQNQSEKHHGAGLSCSSILTVVLALVCAGVLLAAVLIVVILRRLKRSTSEGKGSVISINDIPRTVSKFPSSPVKDSKSSSIDGGSLSRSYTKRKGVQVFTYKELEAATNNFNEANVIGNGDRGVVYRGVVDNGVLVAIKMLHREGKHAERAFRIEVDLLSRLQSNYLVELFGYCADSHHRLLVFEYMPNGNLGHHLHGREGMALDWDARLRIAVDCAKALEFLHEHTSPAVIHRDFNCGNVLLDRSFRAKVSDLGMARMGSDRINGQISTRVMGTTGYLAPEYASTGRLTTKSDVYSYGVVLLELLTGRTPVDNMRPTGEHVLVSWALPRLTNREKVEEMIDPVLQGRYSKIDLVQVAAIAAMCVQPEPEYRPLMTDVVQSLIPLVKNPLSP